MPDGPDSRARWSESTGARHLPETMPRAYGESLQKCPKCCNQTVTLVNAAEVRWYAVAWVPLETAVEMGLSTEVLWCRCQRCNWPWFEPCADRVSELKAN